MKYVGYFTVERDRKTTIISLAEEQKFMTKNHHDSTSHALGKEGLGPQLPQTISSSFWNIGSRTILKNAP